ncbi:S9 family peptidase [Mucilaginibacter gynuensis]|uniref:S9 family peptidase n=1 Tax=Mucilaginibacter gynuensis TaxID=1302236 RepID=A0ABP8FTK3_9SPHI
MGKFNVILAACFLAAAFSACKQHGSEARTPKPYTSEQLRENISLFGAGFSKDETHVLTGNNSTGIFNVYELNIADTTSKALTKSKTDAFFPADYIGTNQFLYYSNKGGDENDHLYLATIGDSTAKDLTPWPGSKNAFVGWSGDKKSVYVTSNKRNPQFFDLYKLDTASWKASLVFQNDSGYDIPIPIVISKDERYISFTKSITTDKNELYLYDIKAKTTKQLSNGSESAWNPQAIEKDNNTFYYTTNDGSDFTYLVKYNISTGAKEKVYSTNWDVQWFELSENEKYYTIAINEDGKNKIILFDHATNKPVDFPEIKGGSVTYASVSKSEKKALLSVGSSTSPDNLYVYNFEDKELKKLTSSLNKAIDENDLAPAEVIHVKSFDGKEIPAIYYKPLQASADNKVGALVWVHGGPGGQSTQNFNNSIQFLVNHGYAVLAINNRGSSGYGKAFYKLDNRDHGYGDLKDCVWAKKWLSQQEYIDSNAVAIYGGSYGGNMVLNALCMYPGEFKAGVDLFGVANWLRTLRSIPPYWASFKDALYVEMGDPETKDSVLLKNTSPLYNYTKIKDPLLVFQGANDVRVLKIESDEIAAGVKKNGVPVEYIVYPQEGHGFRKKENLITTDNTTLAFLQKYVKVAAKKE